MRKNARFKIISYFCGVMNKQYFIISLKKEVLLSNVSSNVALDYQAVVDELFTYL